MYINDYSKLDQWFRVNLDWELLNCIVHKAIDAVCTTNYYDKFFELHPSELGVLDWNIMNASFNDVETLFVDKEEGTEFYHCELGLIGTVKIAFIGDSEYIYIDEVEFSTFYQLKVRDQNFIVYQAEFYPEEIWFIIDYEVLNSRRG